MSCGKSLDDLRKTREQAWAKYNGLSVQTRTLTPGAEILFENLSDERQRTIEAAEREYEAADADWRVHFGTDTALTEEDHPVGYDENDRGS